MNEGEVRRWLRYAREDLAEWAVEARYPGDMPDAVETDAKTAVQQARRVLESVTANITFEG